MPLVVGAVMETSLSSSKLNQGNIMMYLRYIFSAVSIIVMKIIATLLSPLIALCIKSNGDVWWIFKWAVTHDAPLDAWWTDGYQMDNWVKKRYTQEDYDNKSWIRWYSRMKWIVRNPAYGWSKWIGYDQRGMDMVKHKDGSHLWDKGYPNTSYYTAVNARGQKAFLFQKQIYLFGTQFCIEIYLGWKLFWNEPDQTCMAVARIAPKRYEKQPI